MKRLTLHRIASLLLLPTSGSNEPTGPTKLESCFLFGTSDQGLLHQPAPPPPTYPVNKHVYMFTKLPILYPVCTVHMYIAAGFFVASFCGGGGGGDTDGSR